jgi:hypothetical protein
VKPDTAKRVPSPESPVSRPTTHDSRLTTHLS